jgi:hypothetical protein
MKKLMLGTAIASLVANIAMAETKVSGYLETTISMNSTKASSTATEDSNPASIGHEASIDLSTSKELDNGMTMSAGFGIESPSTSSVGRATDQYVKLSSGAVTFAIGNDVTGVTDNVSQEDFTPHIAQSFHDAVIGTGSISGVNTAHGGNGIYLIYKTDMATVETVYSPDSNNGDTTAASANGTREATSTSAASGYDIAVHGSFGVEGLKAGYGLSKITNTLSSQNDKEGKSYGASYSTGGFTVGAGKSTNTAAGATTDTANTTYGIAYKASDALSVGLYGGKVSDDTVAKDEDYQSIQVGYDLGGMGITLGWYQIENNDGTEGADGEKLEIRTVTKF